MTGPEHYREAGRLITEARATAQASTLGSTHPYAQTTAEAQVHAMLALAAATGGATTGAGGRTLPVPSSAADSSANRVTNSVAIATDDDGRQRTMTDGHPEVR